MIKSISINETKNMMVYAGLQIISNQDYLNEADRKIGDGDHGSSMAKGFRAANMKLDRAHYETISEIFSSIGDELIYSIGGSSGVIFGTLFRSGSKELVAKKELDSSGLAVFLQSALNAILKRGGANLGDKSMVDALHPAAMKAQEMREAPLSKALNEIAQEAFNGMEDTKKMRAGIGRAKYYGDSTIGHPDPGAITIYLLFRSMSDYLANFEKICMNDDSDTKS